YFAEINETFPTCFLFGHENDDCTTQPVKIRNSFQRINPAHQYVPRKYKGEITNEFGIFTQDRLVWDPKTDINERNREMYASIHNLWQVWYNDDGSATTPDQRPVRPMVYYAVGWPDRLTSTIHSVEDKWNKIFQKVVSAAVGYDY